MNSRSLSWMLVLALSGMGTAEAFFDYENRPDTKALLETCGDRGRVIEVGSGYADSVDTFGVDVPFREAIGLLAPSTWKVRTVGVPSGLAMTWEGERPWIDIFHTLADKYGLCVAVDWKTRELWIQGTKTTREVVAQSKRRLPRTDVAYLDAKGNKDADKKDAKAREVATYWKLEGGKMLDATLAEWARKAGWSLAWNLDVRYRVPYDTVVSGKFVDAVRKVLAAYHDAQIPLAAIVHRGGIGKPVLEIVPYIPFKNRVIESGGFQ